MSIILSVWKKQTECGKAARWERHRGKDQQWGKERERQRETEWKTDGCFLFWHFQKISQKPCHLCQRFDSHIIATWREYDNALIYVWKQLDYSTTLQFFQWYIWEFDSWRLTDGIFFQCFPPRLMASQDTIVFNTPLLCFDCWYSLWQISVIILSTV